MLGLFLAAVSPAVVVPFNVKIKESGLGQKKVCPTLVLSAVQLMNVLCHNYILQFFMGILCQ